MDVHARAAVPEGRIRAAHPSMLPQTLLLPPARQDRNRFGLGAAPLRAVRPLDRENALGRGCCSLGSLPMPANMGEPTGSIPTDRGQPGTKRHLLIGASGRSL